MTGKHDGPQSPIIREKLALAQTGSCSTKTKRKRRTSYVILLLDAIILVFIFAWIRTGDTPETGYASTSIFWKNAEIRLSSVERQSELLTTVSLSTGDVPLDIILDRDSVARLHIDTGNKYCDKQVGPGINRLTMGPHEARSFVVSCSFDELGFRPKTRSNSPWRFFNREQGTPFTISATINTADNITLKLDSAIKGAEDAATP